MIAKDGYSINSEELFISNEFTAINNLIIDKKSTTEINVSFQEYTAIEDGEINQTTYEILKKAFNISPS